MKIFGGCALVHQLARSVRLNERCWWFVEAQTTLESRQEMGATIMGTDITETFAPFGGAMATHGTTQLNYHIRGPEGGPVVVLVAGLGSHRTEWSDELLRSFHAAGYRTLCADNRDCGRSTILNSDYGDGFNPLAVTAEYSLRDMALDLVAVLDHASVRIAHVLGVSMGGMIAQHLAIEAPERIATFASIMSTTGGRSVGYPHDQTKWIFRTTAPTGSQETYLRYALDHHKSVTSAQYFEPGQVAAQAKLAWARGISPSGTARQLAAIREDGDRTGKLGSISVPALVIHGTDDPMIDASGGVATAEAIEGAQLQLIEGMGHYLPSVLTGDVVLILKDHFSRAKV